MTGPEIVLAQVAKWRERMADEGTAHLPFVLLTRQEMATLVDWVEKAAQSGEGVWRIAKERRTHEGRGWTAEHDDRHPAGELAAQATAWAVCSGDELRNLERAGSLIAAEIDRLLRLQRRPTEIAE